MIFTLFCVSSYLHRHAFPPKMRIQEKVIYTDGGFHLKSGFRKKLSTLNIPSVQFISKIYLLRMDMRAPVGMCCDCKFIALLACSSVSKLKFSYNFFFMTQKSGQLEVNIFYQCKWVNGCTIHIKKLKTTVEYDLKRPQNASGFACLFLLLPSLTVPQHQCNRTPLLQLTASLHNCPTIIGQFWCSNQSTGLQ